MKRSERRQPPQGGGGPRSLADFLARAGVRDRYPHYDLGAAEARLLHADPLAPAHGARPRCRPVLGWSDPARDCPLDSERARRDLTAACLASVCAPGAETQLGTFLSCEHTDPAGSVVFGCLLYLAGLREGARFWWQFAAGAGTSRTAAAAYCLFLDHSRRGEHHDARVWARELHCRGFRPGGHREPREARPCAQAAVLRYVDQLDDPDLGPVPLPRPGLPGVLAAFRPTPAVVPVAGAAATAVSPEAAASRFGSGPPRHPALTAAVRGTVVQTATGAALAQARRALGVVRVLERHPLGVGLRRLARTSGLTEAQLRPLLSMLCEEEYAYRAGAGFYARGPALDRLSAPGGGPTGRLRSTPVLARDSAGAAVHPGRYAEGEVRIAQTAGGRGAPPVREWVDFRAAAHTCAADTCLPSQPDRDHRADHAEQPRPALFTAQTITGSRALFTALDAVAPGAGVHALLGCSPGVLCQEVPISARSAAGSLVLPLPAPRARRPRPATESLHRKAVPVLLALLLTGTIPPSATLPEATPLPTRPDLPVLGT
ncbi:helix-turn-helix domain-containing protein [Streptomyces sp. CB00455]|uniref:helix-turn-helix domain-containing protein n=1 Tax=Streptomyces sp. CB00455 TaxID=1703927 RepID=UPI00093AA2F7|nr:hypothetical protein [Streptomyces sp. CB00455]